MPTDLSQVYELIKELALYENEPDEPTVSLDEFIQDGSGANPNFHVIVAEENNQILGIALYYLGYSTWKGRMLYLDDLVIKKAHRKRGIGSMLFQSILEEAKKHKVNQVRWHVLNWNEPAILFYKKINASLESDWITCKIEKNALYLS